MMVRVLAHDDPAWAATAVETAELYRWHGVDNARADGRTVWMRAALFLRMVDEGALQPGSALTPEGRQLLGTALEEQFRRIGVGA